MGSHMDDALAELREAFVFDSLEHALPLVAMLAERSSPGMASLIFVDDERRLLDMFFIEDGADHLPELLYLLCSPDEPEYSGLLLLTDRTGEDPVDRPDDELVWQELVDLAASGATTLLDWKRTEAAQTTWSSSSATSRYADAGGYVSPVRSAMAGRRACHPHHRFGDPVVRGGHHRRGQGRRRFDHVAQGRERGPD